MKRLLLLTLAAIPLFAFGGNFIFCHYDYYEDDYGYNGYWEDEYWYDGYWEYYPHGYYCVYYVWWYPWWWDVFWWRCHWCHHFYWDFFYCGFYIVWFEDGCWWFRPRYGRWVRYRLPYSYREIWYRAKEHGIYLPKKQPREVIVPYKGGKIMELTKQKDPELFMRVEKERKSGNLEKMRRDYTTKMKKDITRKNQEYRIKKNQMKSSKSFDKNKQSAYTPTKHTYKNDSERQSTQYQAKKDYQQTKSPSHITKKEKDKSRVNKESYSGYEDNNKSNKTEGKGRKSPDEKYEGEGRQPAKDHNKKSQKYEEGKRPVKSRDGKRLSPYSSKYKR